MIPVFALGRTQQLVLMLHRLSVENRIPQIPIFVDSPLATNVTEVFRSHPECFDLETSKFLREERDPFAFGRLRYTRNVEESKALNRQHGPMIIIAASGMAESGRILTGDDPYLAATLHDFAWLLHDQGAYDEAEARYREALAMRRRLYGEMHPEVAASASTSHKCFSMITSPVEKSW